MPKGVQSNPTEMKAEGLSQLWLGHLETGGQTHRKSNPLWELRFILTKCLSRFICVRVSGYQLPPLARGCWMPPGIKARDREERLLPMAETQ